jgi:hypothetical protein
MLLHELFSPPVVAAAAGPADREAAEAPLLYPEQQGAAAGAWVGDVTAGTDGNKGEGEQEQGEGEGGRLSRLRAATLSLARACTCEEWAARPGSAEVLAALEGLTRLRS